MAFEDTWAFLAPLQQKEREALMAACRVRRFQPGAAIFHEDDLGDSLYLLRDGHVRVTGIASNGSETLLYVYGPGECLGELALLDGKPRTATAVAVTSVEALVLDREAFLKLLERHPQVALAVLQKVTGMVRRLHQEVQAVISLDTAGRIAYKLLELAERHSVAPPQGMQITLRITQKELAQMVGAARTTVNQLLRSFEKQGILTVERERILICRPDRLRKRIY